MKSTIFLAAVLAGLICAAAEASDWHTIGSSNGVEFSVDLSRIGPSGPYMKAWSKRIFSTPQPYRSGENGHRYYRQMLALDFFDCKEGTSAVVSLTAYERPDGTGKVLYSVEVPPEKRQFVNLVPETFTEATAKVACAKPHPSM
ncbi:MAG: hypothetical protein JWR21_14 [Herminiimonas sp.]|nr:hypothetical protein [Herminiimonas sp.]